MKHLGPVEATPERTGVGCSFWFLSVLLIEFSGKALLKKGLYS